MPNPITPGRPLRLYTAEGNYLDYSTDRLVGDRMNLYKGWVCGVGTQNIFVDMDGEVYGASCRVGGRFGNIYDDISTPSSWLKCTKNACSCGADLFVPKAKDEFSRSKLQYAGDLPTSSELLQKAKESDVFVAMEPSDPMFAKQVYWELGRRCNYDCSYCFPGIHNKTDPHKSLEQLIKATMLVEEEFCRGDQAHFVISGGEPTINPALMDWVKFLFSMGHKVSMHSNGSRRPEYYRELIHYTNLNISVHFEFLNSDRLLSVVSEITGLKIQTENEGLGHLEMKLMAPPDRIQQALDFEKQLKKINRFKDFCTWAIVPIREGDFGELVQEGYKEADFALFGDRA